MLDKDIISKLLNTVDCIVENCEIILEEINSMSAEDMQDTLYSIDFLARSQIQELEYYNIK